MSRRYKGGVISATAPTVSYSVAPGIWTLQQQLQAIGSSGWPTPVPPGQQAYTTAGTYSWTCPAGVTSVSVVCIGGGGAYVFNSSTSQFQHGGGGALAYANNIAVIPGNSYAVVVGAVGNAISPITNGGDSSFNSTSCAAGGGGTSPAIGTLAAGGAFLYGTGGGYGGYGGISTANSNRGGGGGAGGYSGSGGSGGNAGSAGVSGSGGGGGGGGGGFPTFAYFPPSAAGGGTGIFGEGASGAGGAIGVKGGPGSNGIVSSSDQIGGSYGGGGAGATSSTTEGSGAVRIIWAGTSGITRAFPSTNTGDL